MLSLRSLTLIAAIAVAACAGTPAASTGAPSGVPSASASAASPPTPRSAAPNPSASAAVGRFRIDAVAGTLDLRAANPLGAGDGGPATGAPLQQLFALAVSPEGDVYTAESILGARPGDVQTVVRRIDHRTGLIATIAGPAVLGYVGALAFASDGDLLIAGSYSAGAIWKLHQGRLVPFAGTSKSGDRGDGGPALNATIFGPAGLAYDRIGNLLVADWGDGRIRRIRPDGIIESYGTAPPRPFGFAVDRDGNAYVASDAAEGGSNVAKIYRIAPDGRGTVIAGGESGFSGDGGPAAAARFSDISALAVAPDGSLVVLDTGSFRVRRIDPAGIVSTIAGTGRGMGYGYRGDGGDAIDADLTLTRLLAAGPGGTLYIGATFPNTIRRLVPLP